MLLCVLLFYARRGKTTNFSLLRLFIRKCSKEEDKSLIAAGIKKAHSKINDEDSSEKEDISFADQVA